MAQRGGGDNGFNSDEHRALKQIAPRAPEIIDVLDTRKFWRRAYLTLKRTLIALLAVAAGLGTMSAAIVAFKEMIKRVFP